MDRACGHNPFLSFLSRIMSAGPYYCRHNPFLAESYSIARLSGFPVSNYNIIKLQASVALLFLPFALGRG